MTANNFTLAKKVLFIVARIFKPPLLKTKSVKTWKGRNLEGSKLERDKT
ncbi:MULTISPECIES: hypothetical protein [Bartonella]|nr:MULTISPECIES: hypothetical protein [Bartonella]MBH9975970.1 hypothetical protein [Bartonella choladocola]MBI0141328.1 hypothetical protein [Bartonella choladocola]